MAKATASGETKAPLVIALVFFVLTTIGLGVFAYMTSEDLTAAKNAEKEAATKAKGSDDNAQKAREEALLYKVALGIADEKDREALQGIRFKTEAQANHRAMSDAINKKSAEVIGTQAKNFVGGGGFTATPGEMFTWNWPAGGEIPQPPAMSVLDAAVAARAQREINERVAKAAAADFLAKTKILIEKSNLREEDMKIFKAKVAEIPGLVAADRAVEKKSYDLKAEDFLKQQGEARKSLQDMSDKVAERDIQAKRKDERIAIQERKINELLDREIDLIDPFKFDKPQGKILRRYSDSLVDIDLGTSDKLRPGIAFSIFPSDTIIRGMQPRMRPFQDGATGRTVYKPIPKGKVEVINVIGPNIAQCRIIDEDNAVRDRIIPGDLLYNALWRKGVSEHVALFGIFDLDGDGRDDTQSLINGLRRIGVIVDAYYDLGKGKWEGEITSQTNFAIEGFYPTVSAADGNREGKIKILNSIGEARREVKEKGILILRPRDAFPRIGFDARLEVSDDAINQAATGYTRAQLDRKDLEGAKPADAPKN